MSPYTYVVTGASRGIGAEFVKQLAAKGNTVFALARNPAGSDKLQSLVDNKHVYAIKVDVTDEESIKAAAEEVSKLAPEGIDVLINNAGVSGNGKLDQATKADFLKVFETNVCGTNDTINAFLPLLRKRGEDKVKKIVNISSILSSISLINQVSPTAPTAPYNTSKAALNMVVKMWAGILGKENFIVYSSHPGWVKTDMGGDNAPVDIDESVTGQLTVLDKLTAEDNGSFYEFSGKKLPW